MNQGRLCHTLRKLIPLLFAFCFLIAYNSYFFKQSSLGNESIFNIAILAAMTYIIDLSVRKINTRTHIYCTLFSFILSCVMILGQPIYFTGSLSPVFMSGRSRLLSAVSVIGFTVGFESILSLCIHCCTKRMILTSSSPWSIYKYPYIYGIVFFFSWLPCYLSYYPGIFSYDMYRQSQEALGLQPMTRHHPPLHTFFWKLCLCMERLTDANALVIYSLVQMAILAAALTYFVSFLIHRRIDNRLILAIILFYCFCPAIALFSFIPTKDSLFAACLILFETELLRFLASLKDDSYKIACSLRLVIFGSLCCLLRNNMIYALIPACIIILFVYRKYWKSILIWSVCVVGVYGLINGPFYTAIGIGSGDPREMLNIPMQQITASVMNHKAELSAKDMEDISLYLPVDDLDKLYNPRVTDEIKSHFDLNNYCEDSSAFFDVWKRLFFRYPKEYIISFINLNLPYWYPDSDSVDAISQRAYIETNIYPVEVSGYEVIRNSKIPFLLDFYEKFASYELCRSIPVISNLFSISTPIWIMLLTVLILAIKRKLRLALVFLPVLIYWCTFLLGPVSNFRYIFPIMVLYPLFIILMLQTNKLEDINI